MKNTQKRAFILNECHSPYIAQAIFILREGINPEETGVLADAERIVASYMRDVPTITSVKNKKFNVGAILALASVVIAICGITVICRLML